MKDFNLDTLLRDNIRKLKPYASARSEYSGDARIFLDANENSYGSPIEQDFSRYPDPLQKELKQRIGTLKRIASDQIFLGNGSDEAIDLIIRAFCVPDADNIILMPPTYGMYVVSANINDVLVKEVPLTSDFQINAKEILKQVDTHTKLIFICSPNNPTGNLMNRKDIELILKSFKGIVVIDEAYADFADSESWLNRLAEYPNLIVLQTFSKAWGLAGLRLGMAMASVEIIDVLNKIKPPYNISEATQRLALKALNNHDQIKEWQDEIIAQKHWLSSALEQLPFVCRVFESQGNFMLVKVQNANDLYAFLIKNGITVRNRARMPLCENCLRITIGKPEENELLINTLKKY